MSMLFVWIGLRYLFAPVAYESAVIEYARTPTQEYIPAKDWWRDWESMKAA